MNHFVVYPSADPKRGVECANTWMAKGYGVVMMLDRGAWFDSATLKIPDDVFFHAYTSPNVKYAGYYKEINAIAGMAFGKGADLMTCIGDDMLPPEQGAEEVARMYFERFPDGFGVLQGTGDKQGEILMDPVTQTMQHAAGRICGSPTFGRGWNERAYGGRGPFCDEYGAFYGDEDLHNVAHKLGVYWQEPSIKIDHVHWAYGRMKRQSYHEKAQNEHWETARATFFRRKEQGFPGHEPKAMAKKLD